MRKEVVLFIGNVYKNGCIRSFIILIIDAMMKKILLCVVILSIIPLVGCIPRNAKKMQEEFLRDAFLFKYGQAVDIVDFQIVNGRKSAVVQLCDNRDLYFRISTNEYNEDLQDNYALSYLEYLIKKDIDTKAGCYYSDYYVHVDIQGLHSFPQGVDFRDLSVNEFIDYIDEEGCINIFFYVDTLSLSSAFPLKDNKEFVDDNIVSKKTTEIRTFPVTFEELQMIKERYLYE